MKLEKIGEHALVALIAVGSVSLDEWIIGHQLLRFALLKYVVLFIAALAAVFLVNKLAERILVRFRTLPGVGTIRGEWKEGFAHFNKETPLGSFVRIENTSEGFEVYGTPYTASGGAGPNSFRGMGFPWGDNRIVY